MKRRLPSLVLILAVALYAFAQRPLDEPVRRFLFHREHSRHCVPPEEQGGAAAPLRDLSAEELRTFERDGVVVLHGLFEQKWIDRLRAVVQDVFTSPNAWDVLYSWCVANFYGAQKAILLHHTSHCGREVALFSPAARIAASLLSSKELRVCEPTEALINYDLINDNVNKSDSGHTAWHRDDVYMPVQRRNESCAAVVRFWIPLVELTLNEFRLEALNNSAGSALAREQAGLTVGGTDFGHHERVEKSGTELFASQTVGMPRYLPGDIIAFAGETPHIAEAKNCIKNGCPRIILSFCGDNAEYVKGRFTSLLPLHANQTVGENVRGVQFPMVHPHMDPSEWEPLRPSYAEVLGSIYNAVVAGSTCFRGISFSHAMKYVRRVGRAVRNGLWVVPSFDVQGNVQSRQFLDLKAHFFSGLSIF